MSNGNSGPEYLVSLAKQASSGSTLHLAALKALGEAGGSASQEYLVSLARQVINGSTLHLATLEALGKACRE